MLREEANPRRRASESSSHSRRTSNSQDGGNRDGSNQGRRSTTGSSGTDARGRDARGSQGHSDPSAPAYKEDWEKPPPGPPPTDAQVRPAATVTQAPSFTVPRQRDVRSVNLAADDLAYFHTEDWPFAAEQYDREKEKLLGGDDHVLVGKKEIPQLNASSCRPIELGTGALGGALADWDVECALKHLEAVGPSVVSHEDLHEYTLMEGEFAEDVIDLAGVKNAPGAFNDVSQRCRLIFTNQKRLVFTQANHTAEVGVPRMHCCFSLLTCLHDRWSKRAWNSFYAAVNASEVVQVFVQQTLTTSYMSTSCRWDEICDFVWCSVGGMMQSDKNVDQATQTLGDHDQGTCSGRWDKTRYMRHALVIRYLDCSTNSIKQTVAMAHPDTPASQLFEMARSIEANITIKSADWLQCKLIPTPLASAPFSNATPSVPLFRSVGYKITMFVLFLVGFIFLFIALLAAVFMIIGTAVAVVGAYTSAMTSDNVPTAGLFGLPVSNTVLASQGGGGIVFLISFIFAISNS